MFSEPTTTTNIYTVYTNMEILLVKPFAVGGGVKFNPSLLGEGLRLTLLLGGGSGLRLTILVGGVGCLTLLWGVGRG